jgi:hypothetical protein
MASWSSLVAYDNVSIFAEVGADNSFGDLTAFLTTRVGSGTTAANQVASVTMTPPAYNSPGVDLFSGLNLGPGTYYLVLSGPASLFAIGAVLLGGTILQRRHGTCQHQSGPGQ